MCTCTVVHVLLPPMLLQISLKMGEIFYSYQIHNIINSFRKDSHTLEQTALCLLILWTFNCSCGLPHALIHRKHLSRSFFGFGKGRNHDPCIRSGYRSSELHVPHHFVKTGNEINQICLQSHKVKTCLFVGQRWRIVVTWLSINNATLWLAEYFRMIDMSETWIGTTSHHRLAIWAPI